MKKILFEGFLQEKVIYQVCKIYWEIRLEDLFHQYKIKEASPYLNTTFGDGSDFFNGNPIVNYSIQSINRAVRIIQEEPNANDLELTAWIDEFETDNIKTKELLISIQHTPDTERTALELIKKWLVDVYPEDKMEKFIDLKMELEKLDAKI